MVLFIVRYDVRFHVCAAQVTSHNNATVRLNFYRFHGLSIAPKQANLLTTDYRKKALRFSDLIANSLLFIQMYCFLNIRYGVD